MPEHKTRELFEEYIDAFVKNDRDRLEQMIDEDARFVGQPPGYGETREDALRLSEHMSNAFSNHSITLDRFVEEPRGDEVRVAGHVRWSGDHTGEFLGIDSTNKRIEVDGLMLLTLRDGRVVEDITEIDAMDMLSQMGVAPSVTAPAG